MKMVNFELGNEMWKMNESTWHKRGTKKYLSPWQESNPWNQIQFYTHVNSSTYDCKEQLTLAAVLDKFVWKFTVH